MAMQVQTNMPIILFVAVNTVRVIGESEVMEEFLKSSENHATVLFTFPV